MAALTTERKTPKLGQDVLPSFPTNLGVGMADNVKCYEGGLVCLNTAAGAAQGFAGPGAATAGMVCLGIAEKTVDNTISGHTAGGLSIIPRQGVFQLNNSAAPDLIAAQHVGQDCYIVDDNTVALSSSGGTRPRAGVIVSVDSGTPGQSQPTGVWVLLGITGSAAAYGDPLPAFLDMEHQARNTVSSIAAFTKTTGAILANANGAWAAQDGVTNVVGDVVLFPKGVTNIGASDVGPWQLTSLGGASSKFSLVRPADWQTGMQILPGTSVAISEGTLFGNGKWFVSTTGAIVVDTTSIDMYPETCTQSVLLVSGTLAVTNVPILSATKSQFTFSRVTPVGTASTIAYNPSAAPTPGAIGTATITLNAQVAAGTINAADGSTLLFTVTNR